jgi:tRNA (adenine37-N6)-methyltransferase
MKTGLFAGIETEAMIHILDVDVLDGTPLLDIKPYVPHFDSRGQVQIGWLNEQSSEVEERRSDSRFR